MLKNMQTTGPGCPRVSAFLFVMTAAWLITGCSQGDHSPQEIPLRPVCVQALTPIRSEKQVTFPAKIKAVDNAQLSFRVPGSLVEVPAKEGHRVQKGDLLARLDPHDYEVAVQELEARLYEAESAHQLARVEFDRASQAAMGHAIPAVELDRARSMVTRTQAGVEVMQKNLEKAKDALSYTSLKAPFDGIISKTHRKVHEQVAPLLPVVSLRVPEKLNVEVNVSERFIQRFAVGQRSTVIRKEDGTTWEAEVREISSIAAPMSGTYTVLLRILDAPGVLYPNMSVQVIWPYPSYGTSNQDATVTGFEVPYSALYQQPDGQPSLWVAQEHTGGNTVEKRTVEIRETLDKTVIISGDLKSGELVVTAGAPYLSDRQDVGELLLERTTTKGADK